MRLGPVTSTEHNKIKFIIYNSSADTDVAHSSVASILVVDGCVPSKNVAVGDAKDLVVAFTVY